MMRSILVVCYLFLGAAAAFQPSSRMLMTDAPASSPASAYSSSAYSSSSSSSTALFGLFDGFVRQMEAGYKGDDSAFQKQKAADDAQRNKKKQRFDSKKAEGFTELKDGIQKRTLKFGGKNAKAEKAEPEEEPEPKKKLFGLF